jgi:hypothetical protein
MNRNLKGAIYMKIGSPYKTHHISRHKIVL